MRSRSPSSAARRYGRSSERKGEIPWFLFSAGPIRARPILPKKPSLSRGDIFFPAPARRSISPAGAWIISKTSRLPVPARGSIRSSISACTAASGKRAFYLPGHVLRRCADGRGNARVAAGYRTAYAISEPRGRACEPHFLRSGAAAEMRILLLRHGITEANEKPLLRQHRSAALSGGPRRASAAGNARAGHTVYYERHAPLQ